jgi:hypothetical protein
MINRRTPKKGKKHGKPVHKSKAKTTPDSEHVGPRHEKSTRLAECETEGEPRIQNLQRIDSRFDRASQKKLDKMELARNFYWCDAHDFHRMQVPIRDILAFVNSDYGGDTLEDVTHFLLRIKSAQRHARAYLNSRF